MVIPSNLKTVLDLTNNFSIWLFIALFFVLTYLLVSLLTWSFLKPLKYLGIPTIIVGILLLVFRFSSSIIINAFQMGSEISMIKALLPSVLKPVMVNGLFCFAFGIAMIVLYCIINKKRKNKEQQITS